MKMGVYKYTHKETGKWYIGSHNGKKKKYEGSGLLWSRARNKYGIESYNLEMIYEGPEYRTEEERILKELDAANDDMSYNLKNEAFGGTFFGKDNGMYEKKHTKESKYKCGNANRGKKRPDHSKAISGKNNGRYSHGKYTKEYCIAEKERKDKLRKEKGVKCLFLETKCPHCCIIGSGPNMTRYHYDKCPLNINNKDNILGKFQNINREDKRKKIHKCPHCNKEGQNIGNMNRWHFDNCKKRIL